MNAPRFASGSGRSRPAYEPRRIACPSCADTLELKDENSQLVVCPSCGSHVQLSDTELQVLRKVKDKPEMSFAIGERYIHRGTRYEVIGRMILQDADEDGWVPATRSYLLFSPRRGTLWLSEFQGNWDLSRTSRVMPDGEPQILKKGDRMRSHDGRDWLLAEKGTSELLFVDGALPWVASVGDRSYYAELLAADGSKETYEVERRQVAGTSSELTSSELEVGRGQYLTTADVERATGKRLPPPEAPREDVLEVKRNFRTYKLWAIVAAAINIVLWIFVMNMGREVLDEQLSAETLGGETLSQPFPVARDGNVLEITMKAPLDNGWMTIDLGVVRSDDQVIHVTDQDLSYYHGSDGGESWSEGSRKKTLFVRIDEAGSYRLLVKAVSGRGNAESANNSELPLRVTVLDGARRGVWLGFSTFLCFVALLVAFLAHVGWKNADEEEDDDDD